jgi:MFS transporter, ACS family, glucarate transporter
MNVSTAQKRMTPGWSDQPSRVRWTIVAVLTCISFVSYTQRTNIAIAAEFMMPALGLTKVRMGEIFSSFALGYAVCQLPAGLAGDCWGPRLVLASAAIAWGSATILTALGPGILIHGATAIFVYLLIIRFVLGITEAATYPVAARAISNWNPPSERAFSNASVIAGLSAGSAITPPAVSWLMQHVGWRSSFYCVAVLAFVIGAAWWRWSTDRPEQHPKITNTELALITGPEQTFVSKGMSGGWWKVIFSRNIVLLSLSYFCVGYVVYIFLFWFYLYLVEVRGFSTLKSGVFASLPWILAAIITPLGGIACDALTRKTGRIRAGRIVACIGFGGSALFLIFGVHAYNPYLAIVCLSLSVASVEAVEGAFWSTAMDTAGAHTGAACGFMNMVCNLGGALSTVLVPVVVGHFGWTPALGTGAVGAIGGGLVWFGLSNVDAVRFVREL